MQNAKTTACYIPLHGVEHSLWPIPQCKQPHDMIVASYVLRAWPVYVISKAHITQQVSFKKEVVVRVNDLVFWFNSVVEFLKCVTNF